MLQYLSRSWRTSTAGTASSFRGPGLELLSNELEFGLMFFDQALRVPQLIQIHVLCRLPPGLPERLHVDHGTVTQIIWERGNGYRLDLWKVAGPDLGCIRVLLGSAG